MSTLKVRGYVSPASSRSVHVLTSALVICVYFEKMPVSPSAS